MKNYWFGGLGFLFVAALIYIGSNFNISLFFGSKPAQSTILPVEAIQPAGKPGAELAPLVQEPTPPRKLEWEELMPAEDLALLEAMEPIDHATMNQDELNKDLLPRPTLLKPEADLSQFEKPRIPNGENAENKKRTWKDALVSTRTRPELNLQKIIYVRIPKGLPAQEIYTPFWVEGILKIETQHNDLGVSSYSLDADGVAAYTDE